METRRLAIFDIDGTIVRWNLIFELYERFVKKGLFPQEALTETVEAYLGWLNREKEFAEYDKKVIQIFFRYAKGLSEQAVLDIADDIVDNKQYRVYRYSSSLIKKLKAEGYYIVLISGAPSFIAKKLAKVLECDRAYGQVFEVENGKFTGNVKYGENYVESHRLDKTVIINRLLDVIPFKPDLKNSIAVGDTTGDVPLFELVGNPIVFNPTQELARIAKEKQWKIIVERKDVIYEIKDFEMISVDSL